MRFKNMTSNSHDLDELESLVPELARQAVHSAYQQALKVGNVYVVSEEDNWFGIMEIFPDGRRHRVKPLAHPAHVTVGTRAFLT